MKKKINKTEPVIQDITKQEHVEALIKDFLFKRIKNFNFNNITFDQIKDCITLDYTNNTAFIHIQFTEQLSLTDIETFMIAEDIKIKEQLKYNL